MTRGNPGDLQPFDPEIDRTFLRLVRNSVHPDHSVHFEHSEYFVAGDSEYSDFEHSTTNFILRTWFNLHLERGLLGRWLHLISLMKVCAFNILMRVFPASRTTS